MTGTSLEPVAEPIARPPGPIGDGVLMSTFAFADVVTDTEPVMHTLCRCANAGGQDVNCCLLSHSLIPRRRF